MKPDTSAVLERLQQLLDKPPQPAEAQPQPSVPAEVNPVEQQIASLVAAINQFDMRRNQVGQLNPRNPGFHNAIIQFLKRGLRRLFSWYTRPLNSTNEALSHALWNVQTTLSLIGADREKERQFGGTLLQTVNDLNAGLAARFSETEEQLRAHIDGLRQEFVHGSGQDKAEALGSAESFQRAKAAAGLLFNDPIMITADESGRPRWKSTNERVIERAWILRHLGVVPVGAGILDVGCAESLLPLELASCGYKVTGIDIRMYGLNHPNLHFIQGDMTTVELPANAFDVAIALSTLDHIGLGWYGDPKGGAAELMSAVTKIYHALRPGGMFMVTVPYGISGATPLHRIFNHEQLLEMLTGFAIVEMEYGLRFDDHTWLAPVDEEVAASRPHDPADYRPGAVALAICSKRNSAPPGAEER